MILFTVASLFCGMAHDLTTLVIFRIVQGAGGAALLSTAQATMMEVFPPAQMGMVQAIYGIGVMVGPTIGPTLGGWITDNYSWPWIFYINLPIGIVATIMTLIFVHDSKYTRKKGASVDVIGIGFLAIGLGCLQTVLEKGNRENWFESPLDLLAQPACRRRHRALHHLGVARRASGGQSARAEEPQPRRRLAFRRRGRGSASSAASSSCRCSCRTSGILPRSNRGSPCSPARWPPPW